MSYYFSLLIVPLIIYMAKYHGMKHDFEWLQSKYLNEKRYIKKLEKAYMDANIENLKYKKTLMEQLKEREVNE